MYEKCGFKQSMGKFCGNTLPNVVDTTTSELKVVFTSDSSASQSGFRLTHQTVGKFFKHFI